MTKEKQFYNFIKFLNKLKEEKRFKRVRCMRGDNAADHTWRLVMMVLLAKEFYNSKINVLKAIKIALVHDIVEIHAKDITRRDRYKYKISKETKHKKEEQAINKVYKLMPNKIGKEIKDLWLEFEEGKTKESKFVASLDKIEGLMTFTERGKPYKFYSSYIPAYANKYIKETPELISLYRLLQTDIKSSFKKSNIEWKKSYEI